MTTRLFVSDNSAAVHPHVWEAMRAADAPDMPYDGDALSKGLDARFSALFGRECAVVWTGTGTAANALALACLTPPYGGIVCHYDAHVEADEAGAPEFFTHGAKLMLAQGEGAKVTPKTVAAVIDPIRKDVHRVQPTTLALTQATEQGLVYTPDELAALTGFARERGLRVHLDGARFANAVAHLGCSPVDKFQTGAQPSLPDNWEGGFFCPCHGSTFDLAGRVFKNKPAPDNLEVPPYMYLADTKLLVGEDKKA